MKAEEPAKEQKYIIPSWCGMPLGYHKDGIGGCWGISYGDVATKGRFYCQSCEFYLEDNSKLISGNGSREWNGLQGVNSGQGGS